MKPAPRLAAVQRSFWHSLTGETDPALVRLIAPGQTLGAAGRVDVYRGMYVSRLLDVLREDYPRVAEVLGPDRFDTLARAYLAAQPSTHPSARHVGAGFPDFLAAQATGSGLPPFLPDLARLEWARLAVFDAPDASPLTVADLATIGAERMPGLPLALVPACTVVLAGWPVHEAWKDATAAALLAPARTALRVWREGFTVYHARMDAAEEAALGQLATGATFADLCEAFAEGVSVDEAARQAGALLARWLEDGILTRPPASPPDPSRSAPRGRGSSCS